MNKEDKAKEKKEPWDDMVFFDDEEREEYEAIERAGEGNPVADQEGEKAKAQAAACYTLAKLKIAKSESISIRLTSPDLESIKAKAIEEGLPYQTLISSIIHQYANGKKLV